MSLILNTLLSAAECDVTPALDGLAAVMFRKRVSYIGQNERIFLKRFNVTYLFSHHRDNHVAMEMT